MPTSDQIRDFVVSYEALWEVLRVPEKDRSPEQWNSITVWARILQRAQSDCGVEIMPGATCLNHANKARAELDKIERIRRERQDDARREALQDAADERGEPPHNEPTIDGVY